MIVDIGIQFPMVTRFIRAAKIATLPIAINSFIIIEISEDKWRNAVNPRGGCDYFIEIREPAI